MISTKPTWSLHVFFAVKWVRIFVKRLKSIRLPKRLSKSQGNSWFFLLKAGPATASEQRKPGCRWSSALTGKIPVGQVRPRSLASVQPLHVIAHAFFERKLRQITKRAARARDIGLGEIFVMRVRNCAGIWVKFC